MRSVASDAERRRFLAVVNCSVLKETSFDRLMSSMGSFLSISFSLSQF